VQKTEKWLPVGLIALILIIIILVLSGPLLEGASPPPPEPTMPVETETMTAHVVQVLDQGVLDSGFGEHPYQRLLLHVESGSLAGWEVTVEEGTVNMVGRERLFKPGDRVYLERSIGPQQERLYITDFVRTRPLLWITVFFTVLVLGVGRGKGLRALIGTFFSLVIIFGFILPQIRAGRDPVTVCILGSVMLLAISTYLIYGWNAKAHAALTGMTLSLVLTGVLAWLFVQWSHLSGFGTEESAYLLMEIGPDVSLRGIVLGGMIIGALGALDDVCVGQASAVFELINANRALSWRELFRRSLNIGRDHIASMVNTLLLAYAGASLPLLMVFTIYQEPLLQRLSREPIAEEIVRTLVGSIGLVMAVPLTGLIASVTASRMAQRDRVALTAVEENQALDASGDG